MATARVLLIDDEEAFATVVAERLRNRGLTVDVVHSGRDGVEAARGHTYDAVLLDLAMPELDGLATMELLLHRDRTLQIIILTGHGSIDAGVAAIKKGAVDFIEKPADIDQLMDKVGDAQQKRLKLFEQDVSKKMDDLLRKRGW